MNTYKPRVWFGCIGHCPLCGGLCSERIPFPCSKCQHANPTAARTWIASHRPEGFSGRQHPKTYADA